MKKFTVPCDFGGSKSPFDVYIGMPKEGNHPLQNQASWLSQERGGSIPADVMESFATLLDLAKKNSISFEELCVYALEAANEGGGGAATPLPAAPQDGGQVMADPSAAAPVTPVAPQAPAPETYDATLASGQDGQIGS